MMGRSGVEPLSSRGQGWAGQDHKLAFGMAKDVDPRSRPKDPQEWDTHCMLVLTST